MKDKKTLVAYFSASGETRKLALTLARAVGADTFEIEPETPYTDADLNWNDKHSRSTIEMNDPASRPAMKAALKNADEYGVVYLGFPIWWYVAPTIINTFLESSELSGKTVVLFATSGGSGMGKTASALEKSTKARLICGKVLPANATEKELKAWVDTLAI